MDWFLYDNGLPHERVNQPISRQYSIFILQNDRKPEAFFLTFLGSIEMEYWLEMK